MSFSTYPAFSAALLYCLFDMTNAIPVEPPTSTLPAGTSDHGDPNLICTPIRWYQILTFFATNYFAHAATIKSYPGQPLSDSIVDALHALLFPFSGLLRGFYGIKRFAIASHPLFGGNDLKMAARAGALCTVVRSKAWTTAFAHKPIFGVKIHRKEVSAIVREDLPGMPIGPNSDDEEEFELQQEVGSSSIAREATLEIISPGWQYENEGFFTVRFDDRTIHGYSDRLPDGYTFAILPEDAEVVPSLENRTFDDEGINNRTNIASSYGVLRILVAIAQVIFATDTLYRTRGDQVTRYGYAAFGFTVIPYIIMSLVNLIGNLVTPDYPALYMVKSLEMEEAIQSHGTNFDGVVGSVIQDDHGTKLDGVGVFGQDSAGHAAAKLVQLPEDMVTRKAFMSAAPPLFVSLPSTECEESWKVVYRADEASAVVQVPSCSPIKLSAKRRWGDFISSLKDLLTLGLVATPFAIIGGVSSFHPGHSTLAQRVWVMFWLVFGISFASVTGARYILLHSSFNLRRYHWVLVIPGLVYGAPAIGGFVVVGQMLRSYGNCVDIG